MPDLTVPVLALFIGCVNVICGCWHLHRLPEANAYFQVTAGRTAATEVSEPEYTNRVVVFNTAVTAPRSGNKNNL